MKFLLLLSLVVIALLAACQTRVSAVPTATRSIPTAVVNSDDMMNQDLFEGRYAHGFETSAFLPCGVSEQWWVIPVNDEVGEELVRAYNSISDEQFKDAYARLRGKISPRGTYGHLGMYDREFTVTEIVDLRGRQEGDCQPQ